MDALLRSMLDDHRLSRAERRALRDHVDDLGLPDERLGVFRSQAFDLAREQVGPEAAMVIEWLEGAIKALLPRGPESVEAEARFSPGPDCLRLILGELSRAQRSADVCVFTITDDRIVDEIIAAHRRDIAIRVVTDDDKSLDRGSDIDRLASAGIEVRTDTSPFHMHHKFAIFDGATLLTGSYNWTRTAADSNHENLVRSTDRALVTAFETTFGRLWRDFGATR